MELSEQHIIDKVIARLIENDLEIFKTMISKVQTAKSTNSEKAIPDHSKIKEKITELVKRKLYKTKSNSKQLYYKTDFKVSGLSDILNDIASIMKVCIIAIDNADTGYERKSPPL